MKNAILINMFIINSNAFPSNFDIFAKFPIKISMIPTLNNTANTLLLFFAAYIPHTAIAHIIPHEIQSIIRKALVKSSYSGLI